MEKKGCSGLHRANSKPRLGLVTEPNDTPDCPSLCGLGRMVASQMSPEL